MKINHILGVLRLGMGWIFFWAFVDKLFGLGFATCRDAATGTVQVLCQTAWLSGGSPTSGFLKFATKGPFADFFQGLAGNAFIDWFFMLGLAGVGLALLLGIFVKFGSYSGILMLVLMYAAGFILPEHNPFLDEHIIYAIILAGVAVSHAGQYFGFGKWWSNIKFVKKYPVLE